MIQSVNGITRKRLLAGFVALLMITALMPLLACNRIFPTKIGDILKDPRAYDGKVVLVKGRVKETVNFGVRAFTVSDGTGDIAVLTEKAVPNPENEVSVRGRVDQAFSFMGVNMMVLHEEK
jgi:hypothetical protein